MTTKRERLALQIVDKCFGGPYYLDQKEEYLGAYNLTDEEWELLVELKNTINRPHCK